MTRLIRWFPLGLGLLLVLGCGAQRKSAESALDAAQAAYSTIAAQATNLAPDEARAIETALAGARSTFDQGDFKGTLAAAQDLQGRIKTLSDGLPALSAKLQADWKKLSDSVPGALAETQRKLDGFGKPPQGSPERPTYENASTQLAQLKQEWEQAGSLAQQGKLAQAVASGEDVRSGMVKVLSVLQVGS